MVDYVHSFAENIAFGNERASTYLRQIARMTGGRQAVKTRFVCVLIAFLLPSLLIQPAYAEVDPASVQRAIDRGVAYLRGTQNARGGWNEYGSYSCGLSALCTLSLLNAGVSREDPAIASAMKYLRSFEPDDTYSLSLQTLVYCQLGAAGDLPRLRRNVGQLVATQNNGGPKSGAWGYGSQMGSGDPSNSQFALLALGAAKDRGIDVDTTVFERSIRYWTSIQRSGGGWAYTGGQPPTGSMACAGIASMIIGRGGMKGTSSRIVGDQIQCCGNPANANDPVQAGLDWLGKSFSVEVNPGTSNSATYYYYLYALERVGRLSGRRFIGGHDWYREGAEALLEEHDQFQGFWSGSGPWETNNEIATSFALLFLSKGKRQVVAGQLQYPSQIQDEWRSHPEGLKQLVRQVERDWGRDLTWQTIVGQTPDGEVVAVEDLLQTPVLIIRGRSTLSFSAELVERLGKYIEQGGTIFFEADGGDGCGDASAFEVSVRRLCGIWFEGASLDRLPPTHPVWFAEHEVSPDSVELIGKDFWVYGVQACCRTAVFYVPNSLSCRWELSDVLVGRNEVPSAVRGQVDLAVRLGENVIAYATGRDLKDKLEKRTILEGGEAPEPNRGTIHVAMLALGAGGDEARRAIPNAAELIRRQVKIDLVAADQPIGIEAPNLNRVPILWMHGRTDFSLNLTQREMVAEFLRNQGMIFATSICGNEAFAEAFRREMALVLPDAPLQRMDASHPALTSVYGGFDLSSVTIREPSDRGRSQVIETRSGPPILEYATVDNMVNVFFSPLDVSCALESQNSVQCPGYPTADAAKIVANMLLYGLNQ
ncbi:DUF4159 domain-containing protein [Novipirellula artificiosorum]|uniref:DUF4159 domain-containing protein n=1 Tax=Novipirellula artificiosorum TaxID=2528016 RepID=A0A5C6DWJ3_9BACT|nr:DUF4159 domain-containing protein [Novipirellula artificiosorum]TWU40972.1 hypothetical protein Poly41_18070 [Novipirellula artificiosorum]